MRSVILIVILTYTAGFSFAQNIDSEINIVRGQLGEVRTIKSTISQSVRVVSGSTVDFKRTVTDTKGKKNSVTYRINLSDIDPHGFKQGIERDLMKLEVHVRNKNRYIAEIKQGEVTKYQSRFKIDVEDADQARVLQEALTEAANKAKASEDGNYNYSSLDEILLDLSSAVATVRPALKSQLLTFATDRKGKLTLEQVPAKGAASKYEFNLKSINTDGIKAKASGISLSVVLVTNAKEKVIKVFENNLAKTFTDKVSIKATDVENAKHIKRLVELAIRVANGASLGTGHGSQTAFTFQTGMSSGKAVPKPDFAKQPYWCSTLDGTVQSFEKSALNTSARAKGYAGAEGLYFIPGTRSTKRFNGKSTVLAILWTGEVGMDPSDIVSLYPFSVNAKKDRREYISTKRNWIGTSVTSEDKSLSISFTPAGAGIYLIVNDQPLPSGEYFFGTEKFMYAFGID